MTVTAYIRNRTHGDVRRHDVVIHEAATAAEKPTILDAPGFGLYAIGVHPELGPIATYTLGTPGVEPEPAPCYLIDGRLEVPLLRDGALTIVVEGHPLPEGMTTDEQQDGTGVRDPGTGDRGPQAAGDGG